MAAIVVPSPSIRFPRPSPRPGSSGGRPALVVLPGGTRAVLRQRLAALAPRAVFWRRRLVVAAGLALVLWVGAQAVSGAIGWAGDLVADDGASAVATLGAAPAAPAPTAVPGPAASPSGGAGAVYVVRPGDTLWRIALRVRPDSDPRAVVDVLAARSGGKVLQPGHRIDVSDLP